jgi:hypothetical protein
MTTGAHFTAYLRKGFLFMRRLVGISYIRKPLHPIPSRFSMLRIWDVYPGSRIPVPIFFISDTGSGFASQNLSILTQKTYTKFSKIRSLDPGSGFISISDPGSTD